MSLLREKIGVLMLGLLELAGPRVAEAQKTTTSQPSPPAMPERAELTSRLPARTSLAPDSGALRQHLRQAVALQAKYRDSEALAQYQEALKLNARNYASLWHAAVLSVSIGNRYSDETRKKAYFSAARDYATRAVAVHPLGGESNYALALALFSEAGLLSARDRLRIFQELRTPVFLAVEHRPDLPETWQLLGRWYYRVAHYNVLEKTFSRIVLGGYPQGASSKKAIAALEKARQLDSTRIQYCYDLARMYKYQGLRHRAIQILQQAIKLPTYTSEDLTMNRLCQQLLPPLLRAVARRDRLHARWYKRLQATPAANVANH
jgi:tetratricopeptide (TPR) repeat protein